MKLRVWMPMSAIALSLPLALAGCGGLLETTIPPPQAYVLRLPATTAPTGTAQLPGALLVQRPEPGPGLDSDKIVLLRSDNRFDFYAASRWAAPAPDLVESLIVDVLGAGGKFAGVYDDTSPYAPRYDLRCGLRRFEADYTKGGSAPTVFVTLDCTFGRHRDRELLATFRAEGNAVAAEDRLTAVVAAFDRATATAVGEIERAVAAAIERDPGRAPN
jgi:cholesterol transport system auxiliary component